MVWVLISNLVYLLALWFTATVIYAEVADCAVANRWWFYPAHLVVSTLVCAGMVAGLVVVVSVFQWALLGLYALASFFALRNLFGGSVAR